MPNLNLLQLLVFRELLQDDIIVLLHKVLQDGTSSEARAELTAALINRAEGLGLSGNLLQSYLLFRLTHDDNLAARLTELSKGKIGSSICQACQQDISLLKTLLENDSAQSLQLFLLQDYSPTFPQKYTEASNLQNLLQQNNWTAKDFVQELLAYYLQYGSGEMAAYRAFRWAENALVGIHHFEPTLFKDIIGYDKQKKSLRENTEAFVNGYSANNVLLVGARGTGKSTSVKALTNEYYTKGLRLVQLTKPQLIQLPQLMEKLRRFASKKFIIFLDDLSFEENDPEYKSLKSAMEGGVEGRPANVLIYATSNRRHLIKETWQDREQGQNELYRNDSMNETISLSDRFGLIIIYRAPNQDEYLAIIDHYLQLDGVKLEPEELRIAGHRWEIEHSGRSGRTAMQFVQHYLGQKHNNT